MEKEKPKENLEKKVEKLPSFDPDVSPYNPKNQEAARAHKLWYDPESGYYIDSDGALMRDEFGQPL